MNREIGLLFIGIEGIDDPKTGEKAIPKRPIYGIEESLIESKENSLKQLLANIHPKVSYHLITDIIDDIPRLFPINADSKDLDIDVEIHMIFRCESGFLASVELFPF